MFWHVDWAVYVNLPPAQVQVLSAALKAAQLDSPGDDSPTDDSPAEPQPEEQPESSTDSPSVESKSVEVQSESEESPTEEEQTMETPPASESSPVQEQGDEETQTEPLEDQEDQEEFPLDSPVLVRNNSDLCTQCVKSDVILCVLYILGFSWVYTLHSRSSAVDTTCSVGFDLKLGFRLSRW